MVSATWLRVVAEFRSWAPGTAVGINPALALQYNAVANIPMRSWERARKGSRVLQHATIPMSHLLIPHLSGPHVSSLHSALPSNIPCLSFSPSSLSHLILVASWHCRARDSINSSTTHEVYRVQRDQCDTNHSRIPIRPSLHRAYIRTRIPFFCLVSFHSYASFLMWVSFDIFGVPDVLSRNRN